MKATKSLQEVWEMKAAAHQETKGLRGAAYFAHVHRQVEGLLPAGMKLRRVTGPARPDPAIAQVAETPAKYPAKRKRR